MKQGLKKICVFLCCISICMCLIRFPEKVCAETSIENALQWAINIANDDSHGYSQSSRWGPDYDCSSFVISALKYAGFDTGSATYTGNMRAQLTSHGFVWIPWSEIVNSSNLKRGDILLNEKEHTEIYLGNNTNVGAHSDRGYPASGDQTGTEVSVSGYYNHPWDGVLRWTSINAPTNPQISKNQVWYDLGDTVELYIHADNATSYYMSLFDESGGVRIGQSVNSGTFTIAASQLGIGHYAAYFSCSNDIGSVDSAWIDFDVVGAATYTDISTSQAWYDLTDTVSIKVDTICAKGACIGLSRVTENGEERLITEQTDHFSIEAEKLGIGNYSAYFSVYNGSGGIDTKKIYFPVVGAATYTGVSTEKDVYNLSDTISIKVNTICAKGQVIGIDKVSDSESNRVLTTDCDSNFSIPASKLGTGTYSAYFSVWNGSGGVDTTRVHFQIANMKSDPVNIGEDFYASIQHKNTGLFLTNQERNIVGEKMIEDDSQIWKFVRLSNGAYKIESKLDNSFMDIYGSLDLNGANVYTWPEYTGKENQYFYIYRQNDAYYIRPANSGNKVLNMSSDENHNIEILEIGDNQVSQEFNILKIEKPVMTFEKDKVTKTYGDCTFKNPLTINSNGVVTYESDNEDVAIVDDNGEVTICSAGTAIITAKVERTDIYQAAVSTYIIEIVPRNISELQTSIPEAIYTGNEETAQVIVSDGDRVLVENKDYTVTDNCGVKPGEYNVEINGIGNYTGKAIGKFIIQKAFSKISVPENEIRKNYGDDTFGIQAVTNNGAKLNYTSSDDTVAKIDSEGIVTILKAGQTQIKISCEETDYYKSSETVVPLIVSKAVPQITASDIVVKENSSDFQLNVLINSDGLVTYESDDTEILSVNESGNVHVTGKTGVANIIIRTSETNNYEASEKMIRITVVPEGHNYIGTITKTPTCTETGIKTFICSECDDSYTETIAPVGHQFTEWETIKFPTCLEKGIQIRTCTICKKQEEKELEKTKHQYNVTKVEATCTQAGYSFYQCENCEEEYKDDYVSAQGHDYGTWKVIKNANCIEEGEKVRVCNQCHKQETQIIAKASHQFKEDTILSTCSQSGFVLHTCQNCNYSYKDNYKDPVGHLFSEWHIENLPTCTTEGTKIRVCDYCKIQQVQILEKLEHSYTEKVVLPTCTKSGYSLYTCDECGEQYKDQYVSAIGHKYSEWKTVKVPTSASEGIKEQVCSLCGLKNQQMVAKLKPKENEKDKGSSSTDSSANRVFNDKKLQNEKTTVVKLKKGSIISVKSIGKRKLKILWKKDSKASGYQIQFSRKKNFKSGVKKIVVKKNKTTSITLKKLSKGKKYYVRVRSYRNAKVNGKNVKVYGSWSKVKLSKKVK